MPKRGNPYRCKICNRVATKSGYCRSCQPQLENDGIPRTQDKYNKHVLDPFPETQDRWNKHNPFIPTSFGIMRDKFPVER